MIVGKTGTFPDYYSAVPGWPTSFTSSPRKSGFSDTSRTTRCSPSTGRPTSPVLSEHEGFCLPLVESMIFDLPVIALGAAAVRIPSGSGASAPGFRPDRTAEAVDLVAKNKALREKLVESGRRELRRLKKFPREDFLRERILELGRVMKIAFVIQRYGKEVVGGSELCCRMVAERLVKLGHDCTVYTSAAKDYVTWKNEYPEGEFLLNGVVVKRFRVERPRDIASFTPIRTGFSPIPTLLRRTPVDGAAGPVQSRSHPRPGAEESLHDRFIFFTYLYYNTYWA